MSRGCHRDVPVISPVAGNCPMDILFCLGTMKEREHYEVILQNGKLVYKQSGQLIDTTKASEESHGNWIFVMSTSKKLYVGKKERGTFQHSSFLAGGATSAAGKLTVQDGVLKAIWPHSGHYRPTQENLFEFLNFLEENGIDIADVQKGSFSEEESGIGVTKQESKKEDQPIETLEANVLQETEHTVDMDKNNNIGVTNAETERGENQPTDTLTGNIFIKSGISSLVYQLGSTEGTERTKTGAGKEKQYPPWIHKL